MSNHTPGPWRVHNTTIRDCQPGIDVIATMQVSNQPNWDADARLIAAAPELLEALQAVLHWIDDNCETTGFEEVEAMADAALAKAGAELFNA